jgi:3-methyladenine DNA glycosylase/8-oxoguanine DNA glycosylase
VAATLKEAVDAVAAIDPVMAALVEEHGLPKLGSRRTGKSRFEELAEAICYQQLAGRAAETIWGRVKTAVGDDFTPEAVLKAGYDPLRAAGFSNAKAVSVLDLADHVHRGDVRLERIGRLADEAVIEELTVVKGIGRWTAEMFLIFTLRRLDVWPVGDYGVRAGWAKAYDLAALPGPKELDPLGDRFRPYRTVVAWYCWRAVTTVTPG